jgi:hypothetical protein
MPLTYRSLLSLFLLVASLAAGAQLATAAPAPAGRVILATGEVWRLGQAGKTPLQRQDPIQVGDHLQTGAGSLTLRMQDDALVALQPHSELIIHQYQPASARAEAAIRLELKQGTLRSRTGRIGAAAHHRYRLDTPFAALGIRGTDYTANLNDDQLGVYVHSGRIRLAPFTVELGCVAGQLGACDTPLAVDLSAADNAWLRLRPGDTIERISGTPPFIAPQGSTLLRSGGLYDAAGQPLHPKERLETRFEFTDDSDRLPEQLAPEIETATNPPAQPAPTYLADNSATPLSAAQMRDYLRHTALQLDSYAPLASHTIYNMQLTLRQQLQLHSWFDPRYQRLWGKTESLNTLLAARYWPEGLFWQVLPASLAQLGATNSAWVEQLASGDASLWQLPLGQHSLAFTPGSGPADSSRHRFDTRWSQPLGNTAGQASMATIPEFEADAAGRFRMVLRTAQYNHVLRGAVGENGTLFAASDYLSLRGHWEGDTLVLLVSEHPSGQQWMFGLRQAGSTATPLLPQWQNRHTGAISWGHWADFAQLDAAQLARLGDAPDAMVANRHFVLYTPAIDDLPNAGQASFRLSAAEALYSGRQGLRPAEVTNPSLQVDFDNRQFLSRFDLVVPGLEESIGIVGAGRFDDNGLMRSDERLSNSQMQGSFGPGGASAGLLFERELGDDAHVSGITHWQK